MSDVSGDGAVQVPECTQMPAHPGLTLCQHRSPENLGSRRKNTITSSRWSRKDPFHPHNENNWVSLLQYHILFGLSRDGGRYFSSGVGRCFSSILFDNHHVSESVNLNGSQCPRQAIRRVYGPAPSLPWAWDTLCRHPVTQKTNLAGSRQSLISATRD